MEFGLSDAFAEMPNSTLTGILSALIATVGTPFLPESGETCQYNFDSFRE
jgi:hypothetical protein